MVSWCGYNSTFSRFVNGLYLVIYLASSVFTAIVPSSL